MNNSYTVEESAIVRGRSDVVYALLADYKEGHPTILPKPYFTALMVEEGGMGAGTVFTAHMNVLGAKRTYHMTVTEPEPGRVLMEHDEKAGVTTTFTVEPADDPSRTRVTIRTQAHTSPGLPGLLEKWVTPAITRKIYREELSLLNKAVQQKLSA